MGCPESKDGSVGVNEAATKPVDARLPFQTYRQVFNMKNAWKAVSRVLEDAAKDCLVHFFQAYPQHKQLHKRLVKLETESEMRASEDFETAAVSIFNVFENVVMNIDSCDSVIHSLEVAGRAHKGIEGFSCDYFKDMEPSFLYVAKTVLGDRYTVPTEENFRLLYDFCVRHMIAGYEK